MQFDEESELRRNFIKSVYDPFAPYGKFNIESSFEAPDNREKYEEFKFSLKKMMDSEQDCGRLLNKTH